MIGFGDIPVTDAFWWKADGWFYLYVWKPESGWDSGRWLRGANLGAAVWAAGMSAWIAIFDVGGTLVVFDQSSPAWKVASFHDGDYAPPFATVYA